MRTNRPDVVVADCEMPVMDGVDLTREMQADPELARVPGGALCWPAQADVEFEFLLCWGSISRQRSFAELIKRIDRRNPKLPAALGRGRATR